MKVPVEAVVFDLDGTLIDSMPLVLRAYAHALQPTHPNITAAEILEGLGGPPDRYFTRLLPDSAAAATALRRLAEFGVAHGDSIQAFPGAVEHLQKLRAEGMKVGIWTGRERASATRLMRQREIAPWVQAHVCGDDLSSHKPDPAGLAAVLGELGVDAAQALFVGDADVDVLAGAALGVRTLLITHERAVSDMLIAKAWRAVSTPAEAYRLLECEIAGA